MPLAIFDLDNTLLRGDSDYEWGQFLIAEGAVDPEHAAREHDRYYADYVAGQLDIHAFLAFQLEPLARFDRATLEHWRKRFVLTRILPLIRPDARRLVAGHRHAGDTLVIITATNSFITRPVADEFGITHLLATEPERSGDRFTGRVAGVPCYREGKVARLAAWLARTGHDLRGSTFYSDSHNDLPLLETVDHPVAVNPDPELRQRARAGHWPVLELR